MDLGPYRIAHGDVWHGDPSEHIHVADGTSEIAVAYDREDGTLYKHGSAARVSAWADATRKKLAAGGAEEFASSLTVISFAVSPATVAELNACIATTGRVLRLADRLEEIGACDPTLLSRPRYPGRS